MIQTEVKPSLENSNTTSCQEDLMFNKNISSINTINSDYEIKIDNLNSNNEDNIIKLSDYRLSKNIFADLDIDKESQVFFTKDAELLSQYYELREKCFKEDTGWEEYSGSEVEADVKGKVFVATDKSGKVIAGMRFLVSGWLECTPNEKPESGLTMKEVFKKNNLNPEAKFSELSAVVVEKEHRNRTLMKNMFSCLIEESIKENCEYVVGVGLLVACRDHRIAFGSLGYKLDIITSFPWIGRATKKGFKPRFPMIAYLDKEKHPLTKKETIHEKNFIL